MAKNDGSRDSGRSINHVGNQHVSGLRYFKKVRFVPAPLVTVYRIDEQGNKVLVRRENPKTD